MEKMTFAQAIREGQIARDTEAMFQYLCEDNERRRQNDLPTFEPSYEVAEEAVRNAYGRTRS